VTATVPTISPATLYKHSAKVVQQVSGGLAQTGTRGRCTGWSRAAPELCFVLPHVVSQASRHQLHACAWPHPAGRGGPLPAPKTRWAWVQGKASAWEYAPAGYCEQHARAQL
jgi:hypothetical protein